MSCVVAMWMGESIGVRIYHQNIADTALLIQGVLHSGWRWISHLITLLGSIQSHPCWKKLLWKASTDHCNAKVLTRHISSINASTQKVLNLDVWEGDTIASPPSCNEDRMTGGHFRGLQRVSNERKMRSEVCKRSIWHPLIDLLKHRVSSGVRIDRIRVWPVKRVKRKIRTQLLLQHKATGRFYSTKETLKSLSGLTRMRKRMALSQSMLWRNAKKEHFVASPVSIELPFPQPQSLLLEMQVPIVLGSSDIVLYCMGHHSKIIGLASQRVVPCVTSFSLVERVLHGDELAWAFCNNRSELMWVRPLALTSTGESSIGPMQFIFKISAGFTDTLVSAVVTLIALYFCLHQSIFLKYSV